MKFPAKVVLATTLALLATGCAAVNKVTEEVEHQSSEYGNEIKAVDLENLIGTIKITGGDRLVVKRALTQQTTRRSHAALTPDGDTLRLMGGCSGAAGECDVDWDITLPKDVKVKVANKTGGITLSGVSAPEIDVRTKLGEITVAATGGFDRLSAHSEGGEVTVTVPGDRAYQVTTKVRERLGKADVQVRQGPGPGIAASSDRGGVTVRNA
ncbi:DUF4097 family beta strand repeat-containing protein [Crossiella cryophila]|uniref:DUF4097 domain-containing protein n=1 Tax=Crossiella cryophila TaxID=43355 RepID=A0A7W7FRN0_9PSEU|nr:DUF4097 family beta strand repeat-containing protein [Crossiella cryophila]MBB4676176.1 hypothetical protein [Crossiella cryophila]